MESEKTQMSADQFVAWMRGYTAAKGWENIGRDDNTIIAEMLSTTTWKVATDTKLGGSWQPTDNIGTSDL